MVHAAAYVVASVQHRVVKFSADPASGFLLALQCLPWLLAGFTPVALSLGVSPGEALATASLILKDLDPLSWA